MNGKRTLCLLLCLALTFGTAMAELSTAEEPAEITEEAAGEATAVDSGNELYSLLLPLIDSQVYADLTAEEPGLSGMYLGCRPVTSQTNDEGDAIIIIGDLYQAEGQLDSLSAEQYAGVIWMDRRAVSILRKDSSALLGWTLEDISYDGELQMEEAMTRYFAQAMKEWVSVDGACSLEYPALFDALTESRDSDGCDGQFAALSAGTASFFVGSRANTDGLTLSDLDASLRQASPLADITRNDASGVLRITVRDADAMQTTADYYVVTEDAVYHATMTWSDALNGDFTRYSDYVMNSFCAEALGIG